MYIGKQTNREKSGVVVIRGIGINLELNLKERDSKR